MNKPFHIAIAHGYDLLRTGLTDLIRRNSKYALALVAENEQILKKGFSQQALDLLIIDNQSDGFSIETLKWIRTEFPLVQVLNISGALDKQHLSSAMNLGVGSFVLSECSEGEILEALSEMLQGKDFMCGKIVDFLTSPAGALKSTRCEGMILTDREMDILKLIAEGHSNKQMADILFLSPHTINTHRKNIMAKLQVNNTAGLVMYAVKENLLDRNKFLFS
jgi:DNA-binding NarL/FixJ family response regulator